MGTNIFLRQGTALGLPEVAPPVSAVRTESETSPGIPTQDIQRSKRIVNIERLRIIAVFEIIGFHATDGHTLFVGGTGLPMFLVLTCMFNCIISEKRGAKAFSRQKVKRLLGPWLFWSAFFAALIVVKNIESGQSLLTKFNVKMILGGTYPHLWFVPYAIFVGVAVAWVQKLSRRYNDGWVVAGALFLGMVFTWGYWYLKTTALLQYPIRSYALGVGPIFLGFALGRAHIAATPRLRRWCLAGIFLAAAVCFLATVNHESMRTITRFSIVLIAICGAFVWHGREDRITRFVMPALFGVYLVHPFFISALSRIDFLHAHVPLFSGIVFLLSLASILILQKTRLRRFT